MSVDNEFTHLHCGYYDLSSNVFIQFVLMFTVLSTGEASFFYVVKNLHKLQ